MALRKRITENKEIVLSFDSAIKSGYLDYRKSDFDWSKLEFNPASEPTVFKIRPLTRQHVDFVYRQEDEYSRNKTAVLLGMVGIKNYYVEQSDGSNALIREPEMSATGGMHYIPESWFEEAAFHPDITEELGTIIREVSNPNPTF